MKRPNILLLHTDQQRFDTIGALGNPHIKTPNMDRLVKEGTAFTRAYSSCPICVPARHDLISGCSARHHGYWAHSEEPIADRSLPRVPRLLAHSGYQTLAVGKMHFQPATEHNGFAHMDLMEELPEAREDDAYLQYLAANGRDERRAPHGVRTLFYRSPQVFDAPEEFHGTAWVAKRTCELLKEPRDRPWFIFSSWIAPHPPFVLPERWLNMYRDDDLPDPWPMPDSSMLNVSPSPYVVGSPLVRRMREAYFGAVSMVDHYIGHVLDTLRETGQMENTLILFTSDHGEMLGDRNCWSKHIPYEGSIHIPLIACGPGFEPGQCDTPATTWDTAATILATAGVEYPESHPLVGQDLRVVVEASSERIVNFHNETDGKRYVAAVGLGYKFIHWYNGGHEELYDLATDPKEEHDLLASSSDPSVVQALRESCVRFEENHGMGERVCEGEFVDLPYEGSNPYETSLYPRWSSFQFPHWIPSTTGRDRQLIAGEMMDCAEQELAHICSDPEWRKNALDEWQGIGGDPDVYEEIFQRLDRSMGEKE